MSQLRHLLHQVFNDFLVGILLAGLLQVSQFSQVGLIELFLALFQPFGEKIFLYVNLAWLRPTAQVSNKLADFIK